MAITKSYFGLWSNARSQAMADWLSEKLVPTYADSVEYTNSNVDVVKDGHLIFRIGLHISTIVPYIYYTESLNKEVGVSSSNLGVSAIYGFETATSFVLAAYKTNGNVPGRNTPWQGVIVFTKDNDGNTVIVSPKTFINTESSSVTPELNQKFNVGMFYVDGLAVLPGDIAANYTIFSVTTLVPFPVYTTDDSVAYTPDVFYCPTYEWEEYGKKVDINGVTYLIFGPWLIRDEEAAT